METREVKKGDITVIELLELLDDSGLVKRHTIFTAEMTANLRKHVSDDVIQAIEDDLMENPGGGYIIVAPKINSSKTEKSDINLEAVDSVT